MTMAYVFWHTQSKEITQEAYENNLLAFYDALAQVNCPGVRHSATFRISSLPWSKEQRGYEDWTIVDGTWALEESEHDSGSGSDGCCAFTNCPANG